MPWAPASGPYYKGRDAERTPMPWTGEPGGGFTGRASGPGCPWATRPPATWRTRRRPRLRALVLPPGHRGAPGSEDLAVGSYRSLPSPEGTWAFARGDARTVVVNMSKRRGDLRRRDRHGDRQHRARSRVPLSRLTDPSALGWRRRLAMNPSLRALHHAGAGPHRTAARRRPPPDRRRPRPRLLHDGALPRQGRGYGRPLRALRGAHDAHDLMVANPKHESWSKTRRPWRQGRPAPDLHRPPPRPVSGPPRHPRGFRRGLHRGRLHVPRCPPARPGPAGGKAGAGLHRRHAVRVEQPGHRAVRGGVPTREEEKLHRLRNATMNFATEHLVLADIRRFARRRLAGPARHRCQGYVVDLQSKMVDAYLQATVGGFEYPRSDLAPSVRFVGPILSPPSPSFEPPSWWGELEDRPPGRPRHPGHARQRRPGAAVAVDHQGPGPRQPARRRHHRRAPIPGPLQRTRPAGERPPGGLRPARPPVASRRRDGHQRRLRRRAAGAGQRRAARGRGQQRGQARSGGPCAGSGTGVNLHTGRPSAAMVGRAVRRVLGRVRTGSG